MTGRSFRSSRRFGSALLGLMVLSAAAWPAQASEPTRPVAPGQVVTGTTFQPERSPIDAGPTARDRENALVATRQHHVRPGQVHATSGVELPRRATSGHTTSGPSGSRLSTSAVSAGLSTLFVEPWTSGLDQTGAIIGTKLLTASSDFLDLLSTSSNQVVTNFNLAPFFAIPGGEYYWGAFVSSSMYKGRFIAVQPSFEGPSKACAHGWLNIAVSTTTDPTKAWTRFRLPMTDSWTDAVQIGVSDDKVVFATDQWDLATTESDCLGGTYEGAQLRVVDWADLLDGGTLTSRSVSPTGYTSYYHWMAASNVPGTTSTAAGTTLHLAADRNVGGWGHIVHATITGSAKSGTAKLAVNEDLTVLRSLPAMTGPPETIAAFPSGNGFQDERVVSVAWRANRMWLATTGGCKLDIDTDFRACARYIELDTSTTPSAILEDAYFLDLERDTFLPLVGFARDGARYFSMSASSAIAHEPIDQLVADREAGQPIGGGADEVLMRPGTRTFDADYWGTFGSVLADYSRTHMVWDLHPANIRDPQVGPSLSRLVGGQSGAPGGTFTFGTNGWLATYMPSITFAPDPASPIRTVRYSMSPDVEDTPGGPRLVLGRDEPSTSVSTLPLNVEDPLLGGQPAPSPVTIYVQWQTQDGTWSTPLAQTRPVDMDWPTIPKASIAYALGTVGTSVPVRVSWTSADVGSGVDSVSIFTQRHAPLAQSLVYFPPTTTNSVRSVVLGGRYDFSLQAIDRVGNGSEPWNSPVVTFSALQSSSTAIKTYRTWTSSSSSSYLGGSTRYATSAGAYASYTFTGRAIAFVSAKGPTRGQAEIYIDGVKKATINLYSSSTKYRQIVYQTYWPTAGSHTIKVRVVGTAGHPRVDMDAFLRF